MNRSRLLLVVIVVAVSALSVSLWVGEGPLWRLVMLERKPVKVFEVRIQRYPVRGWKTVHRFNGGLHGLHATWYLNGFLAREVVYEDSQIIRQTSWNPDGSLRLQMQLADPAGGFRFPMPEATWSLGSILEQAFFEGQEQNPTIFKLPTKSGAIMPIMGFSVTSNYKLKASPPWWWGVENQTTPTAPWWGKE